MVLLLLTSALATITTDRGNFYATAGYTDVIGFGDLPRGTVVHDQYAAKNVYFEDRDDLTADAAWALEGVALDGGASVTLTFPEPVQSLGIDFDGDIQVDVFDAYGGLIGSSGPLTRAQTGFFVGFVSNVPIARAEARGWQSGATWIDTLLVGRPPDPGPVFSIVGACGGAGDVVIEDLASRGNFAVISASSTVRAPLPGGVCAGTMAPISGGLRVLTQSAADRRGRWSRTGVAIGASLCGRWLVVVDLDRCVVSNAIGL